VAYDRGERDLVMVGDLEALRGSYSVLGRPFEVEVGTVGFIGVPGINPTLDIEAVSRIRRVDGDPLDVTANVSGTLIQPRVTLSAQEQGLVESDLVSYLIFGRPTHELATGQQAALGGAVAGAAASVFAGTVATAFSAAMAQGIGVDYLSISQAGDFTGFENLQGSFAGTQVEIGQYLSQDVFVVVVLRPIQDQTTGASTFAGARVEWSLSDNLTAEGFVEDRFLRNQSMGVKELALSSRVLGVFVFREWGY
jgi:autotransporter translocation and assembly factor TamB